MARICRNCEVSYGCAVLSVQAQLLVKKMATKASIQKLTNEKSDSVTLQDQKGMFMFLQYVFAVCV